MPRRYPACGCVRERLPAGESIASDDDAGALDLLEGWPAFVALLGAA